MYRGVLYYKMTGKRGAEMFEEIFQRRKFVPERLLAYGFEQGSEAYHYCTGILENEFLLSIVIDANGGVDTRVTEQESGEEYILYKTNASGSFVGEVREAVTEVLREISAQCCQPAVFQSSQTQRAIAFVSDAYGDELEFLWEKFPDNAIWRRKDTKKWYGVLLTVPRNKLGLSSTERAEILDLRIAPNRMAELLQHESYYPGWHMNKKSWYTVILDDSIPDEELFARIRGSYDLATK